MARSLNSESVCDAIPCYTCHPNIMQLAAAECMVVVPAPVVRLPNFHVYALWP